MRVDDAILTAVLEALSDPVVITDSGRRILLANQEARLMFGHRSTKLRGRPIELLLPAGLSAGEAIGRRKDGSKFPVEVRVRAADSKCGMLQIVCIRDIAVARESKNALCILSSRVDLMLLEAEETGLVPQVREDLGVLLRAVRRLAVTFERLPGPAVAPPAVHEPVDLDGLFEETPAKAV